MFTAPIIIIIALLTLIFLAICFYLGEILHLLKDFHTDFRVKHNTGGLETLDLLRQLSSDIDCIKEAAESTAMILSDIRDSDSGSKLGKSPVIKR